MSRSVILNVDDSWFVNDALTIEKIVGLQLRVKWERDNEFCDRDEIQTICRLLFCFPILTNDVKFRMFKDRVLGKFLS
jgi:hypothetical protein